MSESAPPLPPGGFRPRMRLRMLGTPAYAAHFRADSTFRDPTATNRVRAHAWYALACSPATQPAPKIAAPSTLAIVRLPLSH